MKENHSKSRPNSQLLEQYNGQFNKQPRTDDSNHKEEDRSKYVYTSKSINSTQSNGSKKIYKWHLWYLVDI